MGRISCVFLIFTLFAVPAKISAQFPGDDSQENGFTLGQNYPNPFNPETRLPFELNENLFTEGRTAVVSVRIYNVLQQFVASPVALRHPNGQGLLIDLEYTQPGRHEAYWDGRDRSGREVASGIYFGQLTVHGARAIIRMYVTK